MIFRSEIDGLHSQYEGILREWKNKYERAEHDAAQARTNQNAMADMEREITHLRGELDNANRARNQEQMRAADLETKLRSSEAEMRNRIAILERELSNEKSRKTTNMSSVDSQMKGEYEAMLKKELKKLRKMYKKNMEASQKEFMRNYNQKVKIVDPLYNLEYNFPLESWLSLREHLPMRRARTAVLWLRLKN